MNAQSNGIFHDKNVVVTGAAGGIGSAICELFQAEGAKVAALDIHAPTSGDLNISCDIGSDSSVEDAAKKIQVQLGSVCSVIHAAAISENASTLVANPSSYLNIYNINVVGAVRLAQAFAPEMIRMKSGSFVFISSINGQMGCPGLSAYATSKGALNALTRTLALELADSCVRVNAIAPASIDTPLLTSKFLQQPDPSGALAANAARHPLRRLGRPEEVAEFALFLSSIKASWITGGVHLIDGGAHLARR